MKHLDTGSDKIKKICDAIRHETLEPAKQQARLIIEQASDQAATIIQEARKQAEIILETSKKQHDKEKHIFESSMTHAAKLFIEKLKINIEDHFLSQVLRKLSQNIFTDSEACAKIVDSLIHGFSNKSLAGDLTVILDKGLDKSEFVKFLSQEVKSKMKDVENSHKIEGVVLKSVADDLRLEINQEQLTESLLETLRADFRKYFYQAT